MIIDENYKSYRDFGSEWGLQLKIFYTAVTEENTSQFRDKFNQFFYMDIDRDVINIFTKPILSQPFSLELRTNTPDM